MSNNYLAIDTSNKYMTVALKYDGKLFTRYVENCALEHSVLLMQKIDEVISEADIKLRDIDVFAAVVGAGSFTGIRIGVSTAKALAYANGKKVLAITTFDALAYNESGRTLAVIDARHDGYYVAGYENSRVVFSPTYISGAELNSLIGDFGRLVSFENVEGFTTIVASPLDGLIAAVDGKIEKEASEELDTLSPLYIRKSQAEENR